MAMLIKSMPHVNWSLLLDISNPASTKMMLRIYFITPLQAMIWVMDACNMDIMCHTW